MQHIGRHIMNTSRRNFLTGSLATGIGALTASLTTAEAKYPTKPSAKPKDSFRLLHVTDAHMRPEHEAPRRCDRIIGEALAGGGEMDLVLQGGDVIYAADYGHITRERVLEQWDVYDKTLGTSLKGIEALHTLGNHDMWWAAAKSDKMFGKDYVLERVGQKSRYMSIERGGWLIITLDANNRGIFDQEQLEWLHNEMMEHADKPLLIMSHQPILRAESVFGRGVNKRQQEIVAPFIDPSLEARPVHFLSGHEHVLDTLSFKNVHFHCNGALSGSWWEPHVKDKNCSVEGTPMGYGIIDIYSDGRFENVYHDVTDTKDGKIFK